MLSLVHSHTNAFAFVTQHSLQAVNKSEPCGRAGRTSMYDPRPSPQARAHRAPRAARKQGGAEFRCRCHAPVRDQQGGGALSVAPVLHGPTGLLRRWCLVLACVLRGRRPTSNRTNAPHKCADHRVSPRDLPEACPDDLLWRHARPMTLRVKRAQIFSIRGVPRQRRAMLGMSVFTFV